MAQSRHSDRGGGSNAIGLLNEFVEDADRTIGAPLGICSILPSKNLSALLPWIKACRIKKRVGVPRYLVVARSVSSHVALRRVPFGLPALLSYRILAGMRRLFPTMQSVKCAVRPARGGELITGGRI
jgi:hypothetical protein